jgi:acyl carrier protein
MTVQDQIIRIIAEQAVLDPAEVKPGMTLAELGVDSLGMVEAIFAIEETFDVTVPFNANEPSASDFDISSVASVIAGVERLIAAK